LVSSYEVEICDNPLLDPETPQLSQLVGPHRALIVTTPTVDCLFGADLRRYLRANQLEARVAVFHFSEQQKTIQSVLEVCALARENELGRHDLLIAFGGGVCSDIVTVAASLVRRGVPYARLPTTLLAQVDAAIGLKGGVNFGGAKNYLGCFKTPTRVLVDPRFLRSLPPRYLRCGMAEILKIALVRDSYLFEQIEHQGAALVGSHFASPSEGARRIIERAIELMLEELETNAYEDHGLQRCVDFGHTFSPILEIASGYGLHHGEAVAIDMSLSCAIASELGFLSSYELERILAVFVELGLPTCSELYDVALLETAMAQAVKHRAGHLNLVVPIRVGAVTFIVNQEDLHRCVLQNAVERLAQMQFAALPLSETRARLGE
jgi:3-dehydroquinate synthase